MRKQSRQTVEARVLRTVQIKMTWNFVIMIFMPSLWNVYHVRGWQTSAITSEGGAAWVT